MKLKVNGLNYFLIVINNFDKNIKQLFNSNKINVYVKLFFSPKHIKVLFHAT